MFNGRLIRPRGVGIAVLTLLGAGQAHAETATANLGATANVTSNCTITAGPLAFGNIDVTVAQAVDASSDVTITCTSGTGVTVTGVGSTGTRTMANASNNLTYNLYANAARTIARVDGATLTGTGGPLTYTLFGRVPAGQTSLVAGNYSDTITLTLTY